MTRPLRMDLQELSAGLAFIRRTSGHTAARRRSLPAAVRAVRINAAGDSSATVTWFDRETAVTLHVDNVEGDAAQIVLDFDELAAAMKTVGAKGVGEFTPTGDGGAAIVALATGLRVAVPASPAAGDLPDLPAVDGSTMISTTGPQFALFAQAVGACVGTDDTLPMLTGVRLEADPWGSTVTGATTDRFRLAVAELAVGGGADNHHTAILVPGRPLTAFAKYAAKHAHVGVSAAGGFVAIESEKVSVVTRLLDCEFPPFRQLLPNPDDYRVTFTVDPQVWAARMKALAAASHVQLDVPAVGAAGVLAAGTPGGASCSLPVGELNVVQGMRFAFRPGYVADILAAAPRGAKVSVGVVAPRKPIIFEWPGVRMLLMPVCIRPDGDAA